MNASSESGLCATLMSRTLLEVAVGMGGSSERFSGSGLRAQTPAACDAGGGCDLYDLRREERIEAPCDRLGKRHAKEQEQPVHSESEEQKLARGRADERAFEITLAGAERPAGEERDERIRHQESAGRSDQL